MQPELKDFMNLFLVKKSFTLHSKRFLKTEENEMRNYFHKTIIAWVRSGFNTEHTSCVLHGNRSDITNLPSTIIQVKFLATK